MTMIPLNPAWKYQVIAWHDKAQTQIREVRYAPDRSSADRVKRSLQSDLPTCAVTMEKLK